MGPILLGRLSARRVALDRRYIKQPSSVGQADFPHPALGQDFTLSRATPASEHLLELIGFPISEVLHHVLRLS